MRIYILCFGHTKKCQLSILTCAHKQFTFTDNISVFCQDNQNCLHLYEAGIQEHGSTVPVSIFGKFETKRKKEQKSPSEIKN